MQSAAAPTEQTTLSPPPLAQQRELHAALGRIEARFRVVEAAHMAAYAGALGLAASIVLALIWRVEPRPALPLWGLLIAVAGLVAAAIATSSLYSLLRPRNRMHAALTADRLFGLDERLSTALEAGSKPAPSPILAGLLEAQLSDALAAARRIRPSTDLPVKFSRRSLLPAAFLTLLLGVAILAPSPLSFGRDPQLQAQINAEQQKLEAVQKTVQADPRAATDPALKELLAQMNALQNDLGRQDLSREEAIARLSDAESALQKSLDPQAPAERAALDQLANQLAASGSNDAQEAGKALKSGDAEAAAKALEKAAANADKMSPADKKALSDALGQAQSSAAALDPQLAQRLNEAANSLSSNDPAAAQQALKNLAQEVRGEGSKLASQSEVEQALSQIQQSKQNIADGQQSATQSSADNSLQPQPAQTVQPGNPAQNAQTAVAQSGTAAAQSGNSPASNSTPQPSGSAVAARGTPATAVAPGSPVAGQLSGTGTPVLAQGTPGAAGTPVAGQGRQGQGQGQNQGQQGQGQNQGQQSQQGQSQQGSSGQQSANGTGNSAGHSHSEPVYAPSALPNSALTPLPLSGQQNPNGESSTTNTNTNGGNNTAGAAQVPYEQVYGQYREQAGNALDGSYIPQGYKDLVRDYFDGIQPSSP